MENSLVKKENAIVLPADFEVQIRQAEIGREMLDRLFKNVLQQGVDFDRVPGTDRPTLLKPGGELLCKVFKYGVGKPEMVFANEDFDRGLFSYTISIPIINQDGVVAAYGMGSANSQEVKYKYRYEKREGQSEKERILNPEPADAQNTLVKMASKRAFIDGVLKATGASRMFTQDVEDMPWLSEEKASNKQLDYIRSLFKGKNDADILSEINGILGKSYSDMKDITRTDGSSIIASKKGGGNRQQGQSNGNNSSKPENNTCSQCNKRITQGVASFSINKFQRPLCEECQKTVGKQNSGNQAQIDGQQSFQSPDDPDLPCNQKSA
jgi:hypothetical protein